MKKVFIDPGDIDIAFIKEIAHILKAGGIVALPTETVYGLAVSSQNPDAVAKLYALKKRPQDKPFTLALADIATVTDKIFAPLPPFGYRLIERFWPGPLTIIYHDRADGKPIGLRVPAHPVTQEVMEKLRAPVYLASANVSGEREALTAAEVEEAFSGKIDLIVDSGRSLYGIASTVLNLTLNPFKIVREGVVEEKDIIDTFIKKRILFVCTGNTCRSPMAQILLKKYLEDDKPYLKGRYEIISRGVSAHEGSEISTSVAGILRQRHALDARWFLAKRLDIETIRSSDLIFAMEDIHARHILSMEPTAEGRVFPLRKFLPSGMDQDIPDPIGQSHDVYEEVYTLITKALSELKDWL